MSRYVLELNSDILKSIVAFGMMGETGVSTVFKIDELEELNSDYINEHFGDLQDTAYQRGLNDAWECARELYLNGACKDMFGEYFNTFIKNHTAQDAIEKLKAHKQDDKIEVGDEVIYNGTTKCVVVTPETDEKYASLFDCNGIHYSADHRECKKTGRHYDIASILEDLRK